MTSLDDDLLFAVPPKLTDVQGLMTKYQLLHDQLVTEIASVGQQLGRLGALAHALRELTGDRRAAVVAGRLAEHAWPGTGDELVSTARAVVAQAETS